MTDIMILVAGGILILVAIAFLISVIIMIIKWKKSDEIYDISLEFLSRPPIEVNSPEDEKRAKRRANDIFEIMKVMSDYYETSGDRSFKTISATKAKIKSITDRESTNE